MKKSHNLVILVMCCAVGLSTGCGKKGDPSIPVIPRPLTVQDLSAQVQDQGILLSWTPPAQYDTEKPLQLQDIKHFTLYRKTDVPANNRWDFAQSSENWTTAGKTLALKRYHGILRTASKAENLLLLSQENLGLNAKKSPYLRFRLWTKHAHSGYIAFITKKDSSWDTNVDLTFHPAVHTSYQAFQQVFQQVKIKPFRLAATSAQSGLQDYLVDMSSVPTWKGTIQQIGILLNNETPDETTVELGLDRFEVAQSPERSLSLYEQSPWLFLDDEEGWISQGSQLFGAAAGVLYARGAAPLTLLSAPGQQIKANRIRQIRITMRVTAGDAAYLWLRTSPEDPMPDLLAPSASLIRLPIRNQTDFESYTLDLSEHLKSRSTPQNQPHKATFDQIGLIFPAVETGTTRHILIDSLDLVPFSAQAQRLDGAVAQSSRPEPEMLEQQLLDQIERTDPGLEIPYADLPAAEDADTSGKLVKLLDIDPKDPAPANIKEGTFLLLDTGEFIGADKKQAALDYGKRYTYQLELTDRRKQTSERSTAVTVDYAKIPGVPDDVTAEAGDETITLTWSPPFLTRNGQKIRTLDGYALFRSERSGDYPAAPLANLSAQKTTYTDKNLQNGVTYYYAIQARTSTTPDVYDRALSQEIAAIPTDHIPPEVPTGVVGVYLDKAVNVYWNQVHTKDFAGFNVYRGEDANGPFRRLNAQPIQQASYQDTTVQSRTRYYYRVSAFDDEMPPNESEFSEIAHVDTFPLD